MLQALFCVFLEFSRQVTFVQCIINVFCLFSCFKLPTKFSCLKLSTFFLRCGNLLQLPFALHPSISASLLVFKPLGGRTRLRRVPYSQRKLLRPGHAVPWPPFRWAHLGHMLDQELWSVKPGNAFYLACSCGLGHFGGILQFLPQSRARQETRGTHSLFWKRLGVETDVNWFKRDCRILEAPQLFLLIPIIFVVALL